MATPISPQEVVKQIESGSTAFILDVRSSEEFNEGHLPGAIHIPHDEIAAQLDKITPASSEELIIYCHSGRRAQKAAKILHKNGFSNIRDLTGHWEGWASSGLVREEAVF